MLKKVIAVVVLLACARSAQALSLFEGYDQEVRRLAQSQSDARTSQQVVSTKTVEVVQTTKTAIAQRDKALDKFEAEEKKRVEAERRERDAKDQLRRIQDQHLHSAPVATTQAPPIVQPTQPQTVRVEVVHVSAPASTVPAGAPSTPTAVYPVPKDRNGRDAWVHQDNKYLVWNQNTGVYENTRVAELKALESQNPKELKDGKVKFYDKNRGVYVVPYGSQIYAPGDGPFAGSGHNRPIGGGSSTGASVSMGWGTQGSR